MTSPHDRSFGYYPTPRLFLMSGGRELGAGAVVAQGSQLVIVYGPVAWREAVEMTLQGPEGTHRQALQGDSSGYVYMGWDSFPGAPGSMMASARGQSVHFEVVEGGPRELTYRGLGLQATGNAILRRMEPEEWVETPQFWHGALVRRMVPARAPGVAHSLQPFRQG